MHFAGTRFGLLMIKLTLIKIISKYKVTKCEKTMVPIILDPVLTMTMPLDGVIYLNMQKINNAN